MKKAQQKGGAVGLPQQRKMLNSLQYYGSKRGVQGVSPCKKEINIAHLSKNNQKGGVQGVSPCQEYEKSSGQKSVVGGCV